MQGHFCAPVISTPAYSFDFIVSIIINDDSPFATKSFVMNNDDETAHYILYENCSDNNWRQFEGPGSVCLHIPL